MASRTNVPTHDGQQMPAHLWLPERGSGPGVVLVQEIFGITDYIKRRAQDLADLGYVVLAPEVFWRSGDLGPFDWAEIEQVIAKVGALDWSECVRDGASAVRYLRDTDVVTGGVGIVGFCFGGGLGYSIAAELETPHGGGQGVEALVSFYGSALPRLVDAETVSAPSLHHFGLSDQYIDATTVAYLESVLTRQEATTFLTYPGADHAFDNDDGPLHDHEAAALAWQRTGDWLGEHLPV